MEQAEFLSHVGDCVRMLLARYPTALLARAGDGAIAAPVTLEEDCGIDEAYDQALILGAVAGKTGGESDHAHFLSEAEQAYRAVWRKQAKGKRLAMRGGW